MSLQIVWATGSGKPVQGEGTLCVSYDSGSTTENLTFSGSKMNFSFNSGSEMIVGEEATANSFYRFSKDGDIAYSKAGTDVETVLRLKNEKLEVKTRADRTSSTSIIQTFTAGDTSPSVAKGHIFKTANTARGAADITTFDDGTEGQQITILIQDAHTDFSVGAKVNPLKLSGNVDWTSCTTNDSITFIYDGTNWVEISRSDNT